jgi:hypothetical protein
MAVFTRSINFLPEYYRTTPNKKFLAATIDQLMQPAVTQRLSGFVGKKISNLFDPSKDVYVREANKTRQAYQLDNATVVRDSNGTVRFLNTYEDLLDLLAFYGADTVNLQNLLFEDDYLTFDSKVDLDKLVNYHEYYWLAAGPLILLLDNVNVNDILGQQTYTYTQEDSTEFSLSNGMLIQFGPNSVPDSFLNTTYIVEGVGSSIYLTPWITLVTPELFVKNLSQAYDETLYDKFSYDQDITAGLGSGTLITNTPTEKDYIVQQRGSIDNNPWSRTNRWFHKDVITQAYELNGQIAVLDQTLQAKRPIIEFKKNLKLYNFGKIAKKPIDLLDTTTEDVFSQLNGANYGTNIDGIVLQNGYRVIFTADTDPDVKNKTFEIEVVEIDRGDGVTATYTGDGTTTDFELQASPKVDELLVTVGDLVQEFGRDFDYSTFTDGLGNLRGLVSFVNTPAANSVIKIVELNIDRRIYIKPAADFEPIEDDALLVVRGDTYQGLNFYFNGADWVESQNKVSINNSPIWDLYDSTGIKFNDSSKYPASSFEGTKLFSYKLGSTVKDIELGLPITYRNFNTVGDILFEVNSQTESFNYTVEALPINIRLSTGYVGAIQPNRSLVYESNYVRAIDKNLTYAQKLFIAGSLLNDFDLDYIIESKVALPNIRVFVNNKKIPTDHWEIVVINNKKKLRFNEDLKSTDLVLLDIKTKDRSSNDTVFETTKIWSNNPFNGELGLITLGQFTQQLSELADNIDGVIGSTPGDSNLRDLGFINVYDRKFMANESNLHLAGYFLSDTGANYVLALDWLKNEYQAFKNQFVEELVNIADPNLTIVDLVDLVLDSIGQKYNNLPQFKHSDMSPWGTNYVKKTYTVIDPRDKIYYLDEPYIDVVDNEKAVVVYVNDVQQIKNIDFVFEVDKPTIKFTDAKTLVAGDEIVIKQYASTANSSIPPTPTKLGLYPKFRPTITVDDTYIEAHEVIIGHDGSYTPTYGDYRDDAILELETRIYNAIKVEYEHDKVDVYAIQPGYYRTAGWSLPEFNNVISTDFIQWAVKNNIDWSSNTTFSNSNPFTYNYAIVKNQAGTGKLPGYYREIYRYFYDTSTPNLTPWEMLGFSEAPNWWEDEYGPAPYTSQNIKLWQDLSEGKIRFGNRAGIDDKYIRTGLMTSIPVNEHGELKNPIECQLTGTVPPNKLDRNWVFGDGGPVEYAWRKSSEWPFVMQKAMAVLNPGKYFGLFYDNSRLERSVANYWINSVSKGLTKPSDILCPYDIVDNNVVKAAGYLNIVAEYMQAFNKNISKDLAFYINNLDTSLVYRVGGYTKLDSMKFLISAYSPSSINQTAFVPTANLDLVLHKSAPKFRLDYSGVIIEKTTTGYKVSGYDTSFPYFKTLPSIINANKRSVSFNTRSEVFVNWQPNVTIKQDDIVRFGTDYYRARQDLITGPSFSAEEFNKLPSLPSTPGVSVIRYQDYKNNITVVPYNKEFSTIQETYDFIISYSRYLESAGFKFENIDDSGLIINWDKMASQFLEWTQQGWDQGVVITLSPASGKLVIQGLSGTLENVYDLTGGTKLITDQNNNVINTKDLSVLRLGDTVEIETSPTSPGIYKFKGITINYEHAIVFDNVTEFNDLIYDPTFGYKQDRFKLLGYRTANWSGRLDAPGYLIDLAVIEDWQQYYEYNIGDLVKFKGQNYVSRVNHVSSEEFEFSFWELVTQEIKPGIVPNADSKAKLFTQLYESSSQPFVEKEQELARHLVGYQKRDYLENILVDDTTQFQFYQGFIKEKGTKSALTKLGRGLQEETGGNLEIYPEWMVRSGEYGGIENSSAIDIILDEERFIYNRLGIQLRSAASSNPSSNVIEVIKGDEQLIRYDNSYATDYFPTRKQDSGSKNLFMFNTAGYVRIDDVSYTAFAESDIDNLTGSSVDDFNVGTTMWIGFSESSRAWDVLRLSKTTSDIVSVEKDTDDGDIIVTTEPAHNVIKDQRIVIKRFQPTDVDSDVNPVGFYKVLSIISPNKFKISGIGLTVSELTPGTGLLLKWESSRFNNLQELLNYTPLGGWDAGDKAWLDKAYSSYLTTFITDGSTNVYQLNSSEIGFDYTSSDVVVKLNGQTLTPSTDYTLENGVITLDDTPTANNEVLVTIDTAADSWRVYERSSPWQLKSVVQAAPVTSYDGFAISSAVSSASASAKFLYAGIATDGRGKVIISDGITYDQRQLLIPTLTTNTTSDRFGWSLAAQPNARVLVIGAPRTGDVLGSPDTPGAFYIAVKNEFDNYELIQSFYPDHLDDAEYAYAVEVSNDGRYIFIGEPGKDKVHVYEEIDSANQWEHLTSYTLPNISGSPYRFGNSLKYDNANDKLFVGAPLYTGTQPQQGAVVILDFNNFSLSLSDILVSPADEQDEEFGTSIDIRESIGRIIIGAPGTPDGDNNSVGSGYIYEYFGDSAEPTLVTKLVPPGAPGYSKFGYKVALTDLGTTAAISSISVDRIVTTNYDEQTTTFDAGQTTFKDTVASGGQAHTFSLVLDKWLWEQEITIPQSDVNAQLGYSLFFDGNLSLYVGAPYSDINDNNAGALFIFNRDSISSRAWTLIRQEDNLVDPAYFKKSLVYDINSTDTTELLNFYDPLKGQFELNYLNSVDVIQSYDPSTYDSGLVQELDVTKSDIESWDRDRVGTVWIDTGSFKYMWYEQGEIEYRINHWGEIFPTSSPEVCEWVESRYLPSEWASFENPIKGGTPKYPNDTAYNIRTINGVRYYYYWIINKQTIETRSNKSFSTFDLANVIAGNDNKKFAVIASNTMLMINFQNNFTSTDSVLQVSKKLNLKDISSHVEWKIIREGLAGDEPSSIIKTKILDSLTGRDLDSNAVPNLSLPVYMRTGIGFRPKQNMFIDRVEALRVAQEYINDKLILERISPDIYDFTLLNQEESVPSENIFEFTIFDKGTLTFDSNTTKFFSLTPVYDELVKDLDELSTVDTTLLQDGYKILVESDSDIKDLWSLYTWNFNRQEFVRVQNQSYDSRRYWNYVDWYDKDFDQTLLPRYYVNSEIERLSLTTVEDGQVIKQTDASGWKLYQRVSGEDVLVGEENGTIQIALLTVINGNEKLTGYDYASFDSGNFDLAPVLEMRYILRGILENIFVKNLAIYANEYYFVIFRYVLSEQFDVDWLIKTSFITLNNNDLSLNQRKTYSPVRTISTLDYVNEVKPFHAKVRENIDTYTPVTKYKYSATDFDNPPIQNDDNTITINDPVAGSEYYDTYPGKHYYDNFKRVITDVVVINGGSNYTSPTITTSGNAIFKPQVVGGKIIAVSVINSGSGYTSTPVLTISDPTGTGAKLYANTDSPVRDTSIKIKFDRIKEINDVTAGNTIDNWDSFDYHAADRIYKLYNPTTGMPGKDFGQLMKGVDFPGVQVQGLRFDRGPGWEGSDEGWDVEPWDNWDLDSAGIPTPVVDVIDQVLQGTSFTSASGLAPTDIITEGEKFLSAYYGHAPEEKLQGQIFDTLDIKIYGSPGRGSSETWLDTYIGNGSTTDFAYKNQPAHRNGIKVFVDEVLQVEGQDYTVDFNSKKIKFSPLHVPQLNSLISIYSMEISGSDIQSVNIFKGTGTTASFLVPGAGSTYHARVFVNGSAVTSFTETNSNLGKTITFATTPANNAYIVILIIKSLDALGYTRPRIERFSTNQTTYNLSFPPGVAGPKSASIFVYKNGVLLTPPDVTYHITSNTEFEYSIDQDPSIDLLTLGYPDVEVFLNGSLLDPGIDYTVDFNNQTVLLNTTVQTNNDVLSIAVKRNCDYYLIDGSIVFSTAPLVSDDIEVHSYTVHDEQGIRTEVFAGTGGRTLLFDQGFDSFRFDDAGLDGEQLSPITKGSFQLSRAVSNTAYVHVYKNGVYQIPMVDWNINPVDPTVIIFVDKNLSVNDRIVIIYFSEVTGKGAYSYRMFKDMLGRFNYYRISANATAKLTSTLNIDDSVIYVDDATILPNPNPDQQKPGVVMIGKERIIYWTKSGNTLTNIKRGTLGTGVKHAHLVGTLVVDMSDSQKLPYSDSIVKETFVSDGSTVNYSTQQLSIIDDSTDLNSNAVLVYVAGRRVLSGFSVTGTNPVSIVFDQPVSTGLKITVVVKQGYTWYNPGTTTAADGLGLQQATNSIARFILDEPAIIEL